jgi:hypothetical protein
MLEQLKGGWILAPVLFRKDNSDAVSHLKANNRGFPVYSGSFRMELLQRYALADRAQLMKRCGSCCSYYLNFRSSQHDMVLDGCTSIAYSKQQKPTIQISSCLERKQTLAIRVSVKAELKS